MRYAPLVLMGMLSTNIVWSQATSLCGADITHLQQQLALEKVSVSQVAEFYLERLRTVDGAGPRLNSVPILSPDIQERLRWLSSRSVAERKKMPLYGVPIVVKHMIDVAGLPSTDGGAQPLAEQPVSQNAVVIDRLLQAGAVILGKSAMSGSSYPWLSGYSESGLTLNVYDPNFDPQGSSTGSAVAVAADLSMAALGEETTDSLRAVADSAGVVSIRPTRGLVPTQGMLPLSRHADVIGPLTRTVLDGARLLDVMADCFQDSKGCGFARALRSPTLRGLRLGVPAHYAGVGVSRLPFDTDGLKLFAEALSMLQAAGVTLIPVSQPSFTPTDNLSTVEDPHYSGLGFPDWQKDEFKKIDLLAVAEQKDLYLQRRTQGINSYTQLRDAVLGSTELINRMESDMYPAGPALTASDRQILKQFDAALEKLYLRDVVDTLKKQQLDGLVFPTTFRSVLPLVEAMRDKVYEAETVLAYAPADFGMPAVTVPIGIRDNGTPASITFTSRRGTDARVMAMAAAFQQRIPRIKPAPHSCAAP
jgi:amidase